MDNYHTLYPSRLAPKSEVNPLAEMAPTIIAWGDLDAYFKDLRERTIQEISDTEDERVLWRAQGKLALILELQNLRSILQVLDNAGKE